MPRQARIDAPGALHHIICRGIERKHIFRDDTDRDAFLTRIGTIFTKTSTRCFAWALIPNHFHLLLQTGTSPISTVMERVLTGYAGDFNRRYDRHGHLFQNRYKSILCQEDAYFLELVRYIHLNPLRAGIVRSLHDLRRYPYCGHAQIVGFGIAPWQVTDEVLQQFDAERQSARERYEEFVSEGVAQGKRPELTGGGLVRSAGGWQKLAANRKFGDYRKGDERILGDSDFVEGILSAAEERVEDGSLYWQQQGVDLERLVQVVAELLMIDPAEVWQTNKRTIAVQAKSLVCYWATQELGMTATAVGRRLAITQPTASRAVQRGEHIVTERGWTLKQLLNA